MMTYQRKTLGRPSFTLTELIVVMAIIAIMMSMVAAAMSGAIGDARKQRTVMIITKIDRLIMEKVNEYRYRSVRLQWPPPVFIPPAVQQQRAAFETRYRLYALRDLMRMELPDRYSDFVTPALALVGPAKLSINEDPNPAAPDFRVALQTTPAATLGYYRQVQSNPKPFTKEFESAECLYLILSQMRDGDRTALANFSRDEIGDFDNDGMKEIWDAWGRPISFLRWAPGYVSNPPDDWGTSPYVIPPPGSATRGYPALTTQSMIQQLPDGTSLFPELDQFESIDLLRIEPRWASPSQEPQNANIRDSLGNLTPNWQWRPFALRPLIFSNGPDKQADIRLTYDPPDDSLTFTYSITGEMAADSLVLRQLRDGSTLRVPTDPYVLIGTPGNIEPWIGACYDTNTNGRPEYVDNITNHAIELGGENNQ